MTQVQFGSWLVTDEGIAWNGHPAIEYLIYRDVLQDPGSRERKNMYDWLLHMPTKDWVTEADTYTLNTAFVYALSKYGLDFNACSFAETLIEQQKVLKGQ